MHHNASPVLGIGGQAMDSKPPGKQPPGMPGAKLKPKRKRRPPAVPWKKPKDMPRRPLSAYNLFFRQEREKMLREGWKSKAKAAKAAAGDDADKSKTGGFANLARTVAAKWKTLPPEEKAPFEQEAAKEKARYDAQMLGWRAAQEQKKQRKVGGNQHIIDELTSSAALQSYAAHLGNARGEYPEDWFQAGDPPRSDNMDPTLHMLSLKEQHHRAILAQQQQQHQQLQLQQQRLLQSMSRNPINTAEGIFANPAFPQADGLHMDIERNVAMRQRMAQHAAVPMDESKESAKAGKAVSWPTDPPARHQGQSGNFELRSEYNPMRRPSMAEQRSSSLSGLMAGSFQGQFRTLGEETSITAGMLQQSFMGAAAGFPNQSRMAPMGEEPGMHTSSRLPRLEHRSSIGLPPGYNPPSRQMDHAQRMMRSHSLPSNFSLSPKTPSPEEVRERARLPPDSRGSVFGTPLTPMTQQTPRQHTSPQSSATSILNLSSMVPTPPQHPNDEGTAAARSLKAPPPSFPGDDSFQTLEASRNQMAAPMAHPRTQGNGVGEIRLCEEMAADHMNERSQGQQSQSSLFQSTFEALDSTIGDDGVDFLSNLKFDGQQDGH